MPRRSLSLLPLVALALVCGWAEAAQAYVGPGAGLGLLGAGLVLVLGLLGAVLGVLAWPFLMLWRRLTTRPPPQAPRIKRAVFVGLDGLDPELTEQMMARGELPNLQRLADQGCFSRLGTTWPAMSPVAWSSFATGVSPDKHGIFDFLTRDPKTYAPEVSSVANDPPDRSLELLGYRLPLGRPRVRLLRKSQAFWDQLGRYRVPSSILRVPITYPATSLHGTMLSAMCVPDMEGSMGTFSYFTTRSGEEDPSEGGRRVQVDVDEGIVHGDLIGPPHPYKTDETPLRAAFEVRLQDDGATLLLSGKSVALEENAYTPWMVVHFHLGLGISLKGIVRFRLLEADARTGVLRLYATAVQVDPEHPVLPIAFPRSFSVFLSKLIGRFSTLGLAEDTWALNAGVLDEEGFLDQVWLNHAEREKMFFEMLDRTDRGVLACVFDGTDRLQHMFMRYLDDGHPALKPEERSSPYADVVPGSYRRMDTLVGRVLDEVDPHDPANWVVVLSDHGFKPFRRGVNVNAWLREKGYLALKEGADDDAPWFEAVDWSKTSAYAAGLGGIFLNVRGREAEGIVAPDAAIDLARKIANELAGLRDPGADDAVCVTRAAAAADLYDGPYLERAPDIITGYAAGWRISWDGARGIASGPVFVDNTKAWSGDHCIDPDEVPGVLFSNRPLGRADGTEPVIADLAPTVLELFGVPPPKYMDGVSLEPAAAS
jgi:predicted AlkP superfamily phosphohydrolase/phosphomutase